MYIKKSVLIICSILLVLTISLGTFMISNPFGILAFGDFIKFNHGVSLIKNNYYEEVTNADLVDGALSGVAYSTGDPYTAYMNEDEAQSFLESVESDDYTGVGLYISSDLKDNRVTVVSPLSGSPAEAAGIVTGDKILAVDGETVYGDEIDSVAAKMKGQDGTKVSLTVLKVSTGETKEIAITRALIKRETVSAKMLDNGIGYIQITQFGVNTYHEFAQNFNDLVKQNMHKVVVDLRNNPGGYVEIAVDIIDSFLDDDKMIVYTKGKNGETREYKATDGKTKIPMAILTNGGSASASEIFVGAMKAYNLATVVGEKTFGKGVTQVSYSFLDGSMLKITDSRYYTPEHICIDKEGITPDIEVKMEPELYAEISKLSLDDDIQLKKAVEVLLAK